MTGLRSKFARICVEINFAAPLLPSLIVFDFAQKVEYEGLHSNCFQCGMYEHHIDDCHVLNLMEQGTEDPNN